MNSDIYKVFNEEITKGKGITTFDTWGSKERSCLYDFLKNKKIIQINGELFILQHFPAGGCGMGSYPESVRVEYVDMNNIENIKIII